MRVLTVAGLVFFALVLPGAGVAKQPLTAVSACGLDTCSESRDPQTLAALWSLFSPDTESLGATPSLGPYVELRGGVDWPERLGYFVPGMTLSSGVGRLV